MNTENLESTIIESETQPKKTSKKGIIIRIIFGFIIIIGCVAGLASYKVQSNMKLKENTLMFLSKEHTPEEIEQTLLSAFQKLDKTDCTDIMDIYLHATYSLAMQNVIDDAAANSLYSVMDSEKNFQIEKLSATDVKETYTILKNQHIIPRFSNGNLFYDVDYGYFATTYGNYLNDDYTALINLYDEEKKVDYYNPENNIMYYDEVEKRLLTIYEMITKYPESDIKQSMEQYYNFYKTIYLGAYAQDYVFESGSLKKELFNRYNSFCLTVKDSEFKIFLTILILLYQDSNMTRTSEVYEQIQNYCN